MKGNKAIKVLHEIFHGFGRIRIDSDDTEPAKLSQLSQPRKQSTQPRHPKSHSGSKPIAQAKLKNACKAGKNGAKVSSTIPYPTQASSPASSPSKRGFTTSPSDAPHAEQCQGITKQAKRCTRRVKLDKVETGEDFHRFCHQHGKDILTQKGFFNKRGVWIEFDFWIPQQRLSTFTQIQLRLTMEKPIAHADVAGWIYVYSMPQTARHAEYKVGRTNNINRKIDNWSKQCNKELHTTFAADPGFVCKHVSRLERLIHLELAEYSSRESIQCAQCGKRHREVFKLQRMYNRKGTEFENVVKPMIEKWNRLVQLLE